MRRKKILIWHWGRRGGGPRYTLELTKALVTQNDFAVHLSLSRQSEILDAFSELHCPSFHIDTYNGLCSAITATVRLPFVRRAFWRYVREQEIDMIVCTMSHLWNVPVLAMRRDKTPYLFVLHDALPHPGDDAPLRHWLLKREVGYADGVVTLTEHVRRILCDAYHYPRERTWVVPHGVFPYTASIAEKKLSEMVRLLFFGRILPYKGLDILLDAYAMLRAEGANVTLQVCGSGDLAPYAEKLSALEGITVDCRWITENEIGAIFQQADISVSPYREASQSGVIATAYAAGVPVVVTPVGGLVEQVLHEKTGLIAADVSSRALADALWRMIADVDLRKRCSQGALQEAQDTLSWTAIAGQFTTALHAMLEVG
jgi:glycosyltransferase involved in cell wall biosynthesis